MNSSARLPFLRLVLISTLLVPALALAEPKPKYGPEATPLALSHEYFREAPAPDYWALAPYYAAQQAGNTCSVASVSMVVNAARAARKLTAADELVTEKALLGKVKHEAWKKGVGLLGIGVTLAELGPVMQESLKAYGIEATVEVVHAAETPEAAKLLHQALVENEKGTGDFIIANFNQGVFTGDSEGGGHIAPLGAYDPKRKRVLVLDPDRQWYEPYWVSEAALLKGMATVDKVSGKNRGYVRVRLSK